MADEITGLGESEEELRQSVPAATASGMLKTIRARNEKQESIVTTLDMFGVDGGYVEYADGTKDHPTPLWPMDEGALKALGSFFGIPVPFLVKKLEKAPELQAQLINWYFRTNAEKSAEFISESGALVEVRPDNEARIDLYDAVSIVAEVMGVDTVIRKIKDSGLNSTVLDVTRSDEFVEPSGRKGDLIEGGIRIIIPHTKLAPEVGSYYHRLKCSNGAYSKHPGSSIRVRGFNKEEILEEMTERVETIWSNMPAMLEAYASLDEVRVENVRYMAQVFADEHGLPDRARDLAVKYIDEYLVNNTEKRDWTYFDVLQIFTSLPHADSIKDNTGYKLQSLGGSMVLNAFNERRCDSCKRLKIL